MDFYQIVVLLITFLLINLLVYLAMNKYVLRGMNIYLKVLIGIIYWVLAIFTEELMPFCGVILLLIFYHSRQPIQEYDLRDFNVWKLKGRDLFGILGAALLIKAAISIVNVLYLYGLNAFLKFDAKPQDIVNEFLQGEVYYKTLLFVLVVVLAPVVEEYVFRYYLYDRFLRPRMPAACAALISSALFTLLHYNIAGIPTFLGLGLFCTLMYEKKGYYGAVVTHAVSNLITALLLI